LAAAIAIGATIIATGIGDTIIIAVGIGPAITGTMAADTPTIILATIVAPASVSISGSKGALNT
jgi:hypothetical protein